MLDFNTILFWLLGFSIAFAAAGVAYSRRERLNLEDYIVARNTQSTVATLLTLLATSFGAWILFAPAQAATWGGLAAVVGYALGAVAPRVAMIPLGRRMRELIPQGHTLTEFVISRYGRPMYALVLLIMLFYLFIALTAEITAMAKLVALLAPIPLWVTAGIVLGSTLIYTAYGGLKASIFTDQIQMLIIVPLLLILILLGWHAAGGLDPAMAGLKVRAPQLLRLDDWGGIKAGLTFFMAILLTGIFHQGNWQRVYAARDLRSMRRGFLLGGLFAAPVIFILGLFGLAFVGLGHDGDSSVALFEVLLPQVPVWFLIALIPLGLALVMSSADTAISAVSSLIAVDLGRIMPRTSQAAMLKLSRWLILALSLPVLWAASKGYSVLYLFLLADLFCSAAAFPVFFGMFNRRHSGGIATFSTICGLAGGLLLFPAPGAPPVTLLESFLVAALVPALLCLVWSALSRPGRNFDFDALAGASRTLRN